MTIFLVSIYLAMAITTAIVISVAQEDLEVNDFLASLGLGAIWFLVIPFWLFVMLSSGLQLIKKQRANRQAEKEVEEMVKEAQEQKKKEQDSKRVTGVGIGQ
jgi:fructoselysine-6-P-deglycase FrlB-like protein